MTREGKKRDRRKKEIRERAREKEIKVAMDKGVEKERKEHIRKCSYSKENILKCWSSGRFL